MQKFRINYLIFCTIILGAYCLACSEEEYPILIDNLVNKTWMKQNYSFNSTDIAIYRDYAEFTFYDNGTYRKTTIWPSSLKNINPDWDTIINAGNWVYDETNNVIDFIGLDTLYVLAQDTSLMEDTIYTEEIDWRILKLTNIELKVIKLWEYDETVLNFIVKD